MSTSISTRATLFVGSLPASTTPEELEALFAVYGKIKAKLIFDYESMRSKQCALLFCPNTTVAERIRSSAHYLDGRELRVDWADAHRKGIKEVAHTLFVGNLPINATESTIAHYFSRFGVVTRVKLFRNQSTANQSQNAFLRFEDEEPIKIVLGNRRGHKFCGRDLIVAPFKPNNKAFKLNSSDNDDDELVYQFRPNEYTRSKGCYEPGEDEETATCCYENSSQDGHKLNCSQRSRRFPISEEYVPAQHTRQVYSCFDRELSTKDDSLESSDKSQGWTTSINKLDHQHYPKHFIKDTDCSRIHTTSTPCQRSEFKPLNSGNYLLLVEFEKDDLFRVFCLEPVRTVSSGSTHQ